MIRDFTDETGHGNCTLTMAGRDEVVGLRPALDHIHLRVQWLPLGEPTSST